MKRLVMVRHAKAVHWGYDDDFHRNLTSRGENDADKVSKALQTKGIIPQLMVSSPATRALQTALIFAGNFNYPENSILKIHDLYHGFATSEFLEFLHTLPDETDVVFVFGHNPTMEFHAGSLCKSFHYEVPTCSSIVIDFSADLWEQLQARSGDMVMQVNPRDLNF